MLFRGVQHGAVYVPLLYNKENSRHEGVTRYKQNIWQCNFLTSFLSKVQTFLYTLLSIVTMYKQRKNFFHCYLLIYVSLCTIVFIYSLLFNVKLCSLPFCTLYPIISVQNLKFIYVKCMIYFCNGGGITQKLELSDESEGRLTFKKFFRDVL